MSAPNLIEKIKDLQARVAKLEAQVADLIKALANATQAPSGRKNN